MTEYSYYVNHGFSYLQNWVANILLRRKTNISDASIVTMIVPTKIETVEVDNFSLVLFMTLSLFVLLMYIPLLYRTVYRIVFEKSSKAKDFMMMMGLKFSSYWFSWLAYFSILNTLLTFFCWLVLIQGVFGKRSSLILFFVIWLYGQSLFGLILIIQSIFSSPRAAAITTTVVYFGTSMLTSAVDDENGSRIHKLLLCLFFPTVTLQYTLTSFVMIDTTSSGVSF